MTISTLFISKQANNDFQQHAQNLQTEIENIVRLKTFDSKKATDEAKLLRKTAERFRHEICEIGKQTSNFDEFMRNKEIPFPLAHQLTQILSNPEIQCYDKLKKELSKTCLIFLELVVFLCDIQERRLYKETAAEIKNLLATVLSTVPEMELETRFQLQCAQAAAKKIDFGVGKRQEIAKSHAKDLIIGLLSIPTAAPTAMTAASLVGPLVNLSVDIYENLEERWYRNVWAFRWFSAGNRITTKEQLEAAKRFMKKFKDDYHLPFYISKLFREIFKNTKSDELRKAVFEGEDISLIKLSQIEEIKEGLPIFNSDIWKVRYITLVHLQAIARDMSKENEKYRQKSIYAIWARRLYEKHQNKIKAFAGEIIIKLGPDNSAEWLAQRDKIRQEAPSELKKLEKKMALTSDPKLKKINKELQVQTTKWEQAQANFAAKAATPQKQAAGEEEVQDPGVLLMDLEELERQRDEYVEAQLQEDRSEKITVEDSMLLKSLEAELKTKQDWEIYRI